MPDKTIQMNLNDVLELDYLIEEISRDTVTVNQGDASDVSYISTEKTVLDPSTTGTYNLELNGSTIEVNVVNYVQTESESKLRNQWVLNDVSTGTATDRVGSSDGTVNGGISSVNGDWSGSKAATGNGSDGYIETTKLGNFGSNLGTDSAIAFSIDNPPSNGDIMGVVSNDSIPADLQVEVDSDDILYKIDDGDFGRRHVRTSSSPFGNGPYRVVINKITEDAGNFEIWVNQNKQSTSVDFNENNSQWSNFNRTFSLFATHSSSFGGNLDATLNDVCIFNNSLTESEIKSYNNPWD